MAGMIAQHRTPPRRPVAPWRGARRRKLVGDVASEGGYDPAPQEFTVHLTPREVDKLLIFSAGELARKRRARGVKLNHPEAVALITSEILELIRDGRSVAEIMSIGPTILASDAVMDGVASMIPEIQVEGTFPDGTKLVTIHQPIR